METIIVATDYSRAADNALRYAASLAKSLGSSIVLFNAFFLPVFPVTILDIKWLIHENKSRLETLAEEITDKYGVRVKAVTGTSLLLEELDELVEKCDADLVVLGMSGDTLSRKFLGNTVATILEHACYPVLIVPSEVQFTKPSKIVFACDNTSYMVDNSLYFIKELVQVLKLNLEFLNVVRYKEYAPIDGMNLATDTNKVEKVLNAANLIYKEISEEDMFEVVNRKLEVSGADLMVIMPSAADIWNKLFHSSQVDSVNQHYNLPLLILPLQKE